MSDNIRLIDANALIKYKMTGEIGNLSGDFVPGFAIANAPTVEAEPVRHGRWVEVWDYNYMQYFHQCSECGRDALTKEETMHDEALSFYCPHCGAKMDAKEEAK